MTLHCLDNHVCYTFVGMCRIGQGNDIGQDRLVIGFAVGPESGCMEGVIYLKVKIRLRLNT